MAVSNFVSSFVQKNHEKVVLSHLNVKKQDQTSAKKFKSLLLFNLTGCGGRAV